MNASKVKRLRRYCNFKAQKSSNTSLVPANTPTAEPQQNNLYSVDCIINGKQENVIARYAGKSKSGKYFNFELPAFNRFGAQFRFICLTALPATLLLVKQDMFTYRHAA